MSAEVGFRGGNTLEVADITAAVGDGSGAVPGRVPEPRGRRGAGVLWRNTRVQAASQWNLLQVF